MREQHRKVTCGDRSPSGYFKDVVGTWISPSCGFAVGSPSFELPSFLSQTVLCLPHELQHPRCVSFDFCHTVNWILLMRHPSCSSTHGLQRITNDTDFQSCAFSAPESCSRLRLSYNDLASVMHAMSRPESDSATIDVSWISRLSVSRLRKSYVMSFARPIHEVTHSASANHSDIEFAYTSNVLDPARGIR